MFSSPRRALTLSFCLLLLASCGQAPAPEPIAPPAPQPPAGAAAPKDAAPTDNAPAAPADEAPPIPAPQPTRRADAARVVALGDFHGDLQATKRALALGGLIDDQGRWSGGKSVLVQTGDQLDRGDDEVAILHLLDRLAPEAEAAGGAVIVLNGNHELMNIQGDMRYVTPGGFADFGRLPGIDTSNPALERVPPPARPRFAAFVPGGPYARRLAARNIIAVVGDTVFAHGGVLPEHVDYGLDRINQEARAWALGQSPMPEILAGDSSPVWTRLFSDQTPEQDCEALALMLDKIPARRLVVGHTVQQGGITPACDGKVWRIDVGMAAHYGGQPQALLIEEGKEPVVLK